MSSIYPVDVIKSKIQTDSLDPAKRQYKGMIDCVRKTWSREGWRGFTGGLGPTLIRYVLFTPLECWKNGLMVDHHSLMELHS